MILRQRSFVNSVVNKIRSIATILNILYINIRHIISQNDSTCGFITIYFKGMSYRFKVYGNMFYGTFDKLDISAL